MQIDVPWVQPPTPPQDPIKKARGVIDELERANDELAKAQDRQAIQQGKARAVFKELLEAVLGEEK